MNIERASMRRSVLLILLAVLSVGVAAQKNDRSTHAKAKTSARERELVELQRSIQQREQRVQELSERERTAARAVQQLQALLERQRRFLQLLNEEIHALAEREQALQSERHAYGDAYHHERERLRRLVLILASAEADDEAALDTAIVSSVLRRLKEHVSSVRHRRDSTDRLLGQVQQYRAVRQLLLAQQQREERRLERLLTLRTQLLEKVRRDRQAVEQELRALRKSMETIERRIEQMNRSSLATRKQSTASDTKIPPLLAPVRGAILRGYGEYRHPLTGARAFNAGVDIAVPVGTPVRAVAAGRVVSVQWLPAMNTVLIVEHEGGIRSVYGNLDRASVRVGERVSAGQTLGTSGETLSGAFVHFELWRGAERLDPTAVVR